MLETSEKANTHFQGSNGVFFNCKFGVACRAGDGVLWAYDPDATEAGDPEAEASA